MKAHILIFFALVSIADAKAFAVLTSSVVLVPSLVVCLHMLTTPLWEEDEKYTSSADLTLTYVHAVLLSILLCLTDQQNCSINESRAVSAP